MTLFYVRLPDGEIHVARPGHVNALCGAERVSNADTVDVDPKREAQGAVPTCEACKAKLPGVRIVSDRDE